MPLLKDNELRTLVASGAITALTVDTNIFDEKRLQLNSTTLQAIKGIAGHGIRFILSGTVAKEVEFHIERAAKNAMRSARKGIGEALGVFETKHPTRDELMKHVTNGLAPTDVARGRFAQYVKETSCQVLNDTERVEATELFERYFAGLPPFGDGRRKDEFPDALALLALEKFAEIEDSGMIVVSKDKDWRNFCRDSNRLFLVPEVEGAMALVANAPPALRRATFDWMAEDGESGQLFLCLGKLVEEIAFDVSAYPTVGECETFVWDGELKSIQLPSKEGIDIIDFKCDEGGNCVGLIVSFQIGLNVSIPVEISFSVWDGVDGESMPMGSRMLEVNREECSQATVTFDVSNHGSEDEVWGIVDVEIGLKYIEIDLGEVDVFEPDDCSEWG